MSEILSKREKNKLQKKQTFIDAAEKLFAQNGFENTSIDEVAVNAGYTKKTLYQYFQSKEDLFYAAALKGAEELYNKSVDAIAGGENAREKIHLANLAHLEFYRKHFDLFRILNYTPANRQNIELSPHYQQIKVLDARRMSYVLSLMSQGQSDGSINKDYDMKKAVMFGFFASFSMLYTFAFTDKSVWTALEMDENEFLQFSFDLIGKALK